VRRPVSRVHRRRVLARGSRACFAGMPTSAASSATDRGGSRSRKSRYRSGSYSAASTEGSSISSSSISESVVFTSGKIFHC
jgi:hypothetical protein